MLSRRIKYTTKLACTVPGCDRISALKKHGLCLGHYKRYRRDGDVGAAPLRPRRTLAPYKPQRSEIVEETGT